MSRVIIAAWIAFSIGSLGRANLAGHSSDQSKRIEIDRTSIKREDGNKVTALGGSSWKKKSSTPSRAALQRSSRRRPATTAAARSAATLRRVFKKNESKSCATRNKNPPTCRCVAAPSTTKVLREVCRPAKTSRCQEVAQKGQRAAGQLKQANEALVKKKLPRRKRAPCRKNRHHAGTLRPTQLNRGPPNRPRRPKPRSCSPRHGLDGGGAGESAGAGSWPCHAPLELRRRRRTGKLASPRPQECPLPPASSRLSTSVTASGSTWKRSSSTTSPRPFASSTTATPCGVTPYGRTITVGADLRTGAVPLSQTGGREVNGRNFDMVAHLVHRSDEGKLAVVAVLLERAPSTRHPDPVNNLPLGATSSQASPEHRPHGPSAGKPQLLHLPGILTTPPCTEGVL